MNPDSLVSTTTTHKLKDYGIPSDQSTWPRVSLSNSDLTCVIFNEFRSSSTESMSSSTDAHRLSRYNNVNKVHIIHASGNVISKSRTIAQSAKIHPTRNIIALKADTHIQVYNFETENLLNEVTCHTDILFWKWVDDDIILILTETAVLQWNAFIERSHLEEVCSRMHRFHFAEIVNCCIDETHRWYTITGLLDHGKGNVEGITQVYSADNKVSQCLEAHVTAFVSHKFEDCIHKSTLLCIASKQNASSSVRMHSIELGPAYLGHSPPHLSFGEFRLLHKPTEQKFSNDFPVSLNADESHCCVYCLTKYGQLTISELESAQTLITLSIINDITFTSSLNNISVLTIVSKSGQVLRVSINWLDLIKHLKADLKLPALAQRLQNARGMENVDLLLDEGT